MTFKSSVAIRWSMALLFLWFGTQQLIDPSVWTAFLPEWIGYIPIPAEMFVRLNGWFEVVGAVLLLVGAGTRVVSFLLGAHLLGIAITAGGAIGVRDAALAAVTLALAASKPDEMTVDAREVRH